MLDQLIQYVIYGLLSGSVYVLLALGLSVAFGVLHILNFAHGAIAVLAGYLAYTLSVIYGVPLLVAAVITVALISLLGVVIERSAFRPVRGEALPGFVISSGLIAIFESSARMIWGMSPTSIPAPIGGGIDLFGARVSSERGLTFVTAVVLTILFALFLKFSKTGKATRAVAQSPEAAALMGISIDRIAWQSFAMGSALAAVAGVLLATILPLTPQSGGIVVKAMAVVVLGGMGSVVGVVVGGGLLGVAESVGSGMVNSALGETIGFIAIVAILLLRPSGLLGEKA